MPAHLRENLEKLRVRTKDNGLGWTALKVCSGTTGRAHAFFEEKVRAIERDHDRPGSNTIANNRQVWGQHDWSAAGEEWSASPEWRQSVIDSLILPNIPQHATTVEIGPGAGRWTQPLYERSDALYLVDITEITLDMCRTRLGDPPNVHYVLSDGTTLGDLPNSAIDFLFAFDVFVHIAPMDQKSYFAEFARVMKKGARGVVHHAGDGGLHGGWRSAMTSDMFRNLLKHNGLIVVDQLARWGDAQCVPPIEGDVVTIFEA